MWVFFSTGITTNSSQGELAGYLRIFTLPKVLISLLATLGPICYSYFVMCSNSLCGWWSREGRRKSLRHLASEFLGVEIQNGEHCSVSSKFIMFLRFILNSYCYFIKLQPQKQHQYILVEYSLCNIDSLSPRNLYIIFFLICNLNWGSHLF